MRSVEEWAQKGGIQSWSLFEQVLLSEPSDCGGSRAKSVFCKFNEFHFEFSLY